MAKTKKKSWLTDKKLEQVPYINKLGKISYQTKKKKK